MLLPLRLGYYLEYYLRSLKGFGLRIFFGERSVGRDDGVSYDRYIFHVDTTVPSTKLLSPVKNGGYPLDRGISQKSLSYYSHVKSL